MEEWEVAMTYEQEKQVAKVRQVIASAREMLDSVMYYSDPISDAEHEKLREAYDLLCKANDKLC